MTKQYWHKLKDSTIERLIKNKVTYGEIARRYKQPDWCGYPGVLDGLAGCWSLTDHFGRRHKISIKYCKDCDCFIKREE